MTLHKKIEGGLPKLPQEASPEQIDQGQQALSKGITAARDRRQAGRHLRAPRWPATCARPWRRCSSGADGKQLRGVDPRREPDRRRRAHQRPVPGRDSAVDDAAADSQRPAEAARGARVPLHRRAAHPLRSPRAHHRRLRRPRLAPCLSAMTQPRLATSHRRRRCSRRRSRPPAAAPGARRARPSSPSTAPASRAEVIPLPNRDGSLKFGVLGDFGTGERAQYQLAEQMAKLHERFPFELVILVGDNIYGGERAEDFRTQVRDARTSRCSTRRQVLRLARQPRRPEPALLQAVQHGRQALLLVQGAEAERALLRARDHLCRARADGLGRQGAQGRRTTTGRSRSSTTRSTRRAQRHGSDIRLRTILEPLFVQHDVKVVFTGHDHFYERTKPQKGIAYFVVGSGGKLRGGNIDRTPALTASGFDTDLAFLAAEIFEQRADLQRRVAHRPGGRFRGDHPADQLTQRRRVAYRRSASRRAVLRRACRAPSRPRTPPAPCWRCARPSR